MSYGKIHQKNIIDHCYMFYPELKKNPSAQLATSGLLGYNFL